MKNILIIPIKSKSERIPGKNFIKYKGIELYKHFTINCIGSGCFDEIVIDTDSDEIKNWVSLSHGSISTIDRKPELALDTANGNDLLRHHVSVFPGYDFYWQGFVTSPNISIPTIRRMVKILKTLNNGGYIFPGRYDSIASCKKHKGFFWNHTGQPISYRPEVMPRSQDLHPIYEEICGLFGITAEAFEKTRCRIGERPYLFELPPQETLDIDWKEDIPND